MAALAMPAALAAPPDWAQDAIWYNIFPERFRNGDPSNDPTIDTLAETWPFDPVESWGVSPWGSDWYELQPWERANGGGFYYNAQRRRYGGDLQGILDKLDYLKELGVNALYLNPVFESPSLHKYGAAMFHHIDNHFGPDPAGDVEVWSKEDPALPETWQWTAADKLFLKLIRECHARDMRIIIDGVFNHVGIPFWALQRAKREGPGSDYADWFHITQWDDPATPENEFDYEGWAGLKGLPGFLHGETGPNDEVKSHFRAVLKRWMDPDGDGDPSDGIDGWRLDVAADVPIAFWREFRTWTKAINPDCYLTGEIWWEDYKTQKLKNAAPWLREGDVFDAVMNYRFADATYQFFNQTESPLGATEFAGTLTKVHTDYGYETHLSIMNLLCSHDVQRLASMVANPTQRLDKGASLKRNRSYSVDPPPADRMGRLRQMVAFQFLSPGAPFVYYGDEVGMWGADDPDCRKPMVWGDLAYDDESAVPFEDVRRKTGVKVQQNRELHALYQKLCRFRAEHEAIRRGGFRWLVEDDGKRLVAFERALGGVSMVAVFNASGEAVAIPGSVGGGRMVLSAKGARETSLPGWGFAVFVK